MKFYFIPVLALLASTLAYPSTKTSKYMGTNNVSNSSGECLFELSTDETGKIIAFGSEGQFRVWMTVSHAMIPLLRTEHRYHYRFPDDFKKMNFQTKESHWSDSLVLIGGTADDDSSSEETVTLKITEGKLTAVNIKFKEDVFHIPWQRASFECIDLKLIEVSEK